MRLSRAFHGLFGLAALSAAGSSSCAPQDGSSPSARARAQANVGDAESNRVVDLAREFHDAQCANGELPVAQCPGIRRVRLGDARVHGALSPEIVRRVVQRHVEELRLCYEREPGAATRLAGSLHIVFSVSPEGLVQAAKVEGSTLDAAGLEGCLVKAAGRWSFPAPAEGSVDVSYPLFFEAG